MKYRKLDANGDYVFGKGSSSLLTNTPEAVAQAVRTRLALQQGEWFLDLLEGTPYATQILGSGTLDKYDHAIKKRILDTPSVVSISKYQSVRTSTRALFVSCTITTQFGSTPITQVI